QVRFGYIRNQNGPGADNGTVHVMVNNGWELIGSPPNELDFSLLKLSQAAGQDQVDGQKRGYLKPATDHNFNRDEPILIIQHPQREPMKLGVGYLRDRNAHTRRIAYTTNTEPGSSGSPCFDLDWDLIAIHHHGDDFTNHGTPMSDILKYLKAKGKESLIG
ncbi:MAG: trypsin-like serine peptidase, partial [Planctomycetota bacterium]